MSQNQSATPDPREAAMISWIHDFAPYGVITTDADFHIRTWNRWMESHSGKDTASMLGKDLFEVFPDLKERGLSPRFHRALEGEVSVLSTALHGYLLSLNPSIPESGFKEMQQTARIAPLRYKDQTVGSIIVIEDVTQRELQSLIQRRQHDRDNILSWALGHLLESQQPRRSIRDLFCKVAEQFDFDAYLLFLREPDGQSVKLQTAGGIAPEAQENLAATGPGQLPENLFAHLSHPVAMERLDTVKTDAAILHERFGFRACAALPLIAGGENFGALCFATRSRAALQEGELELLGTIGQYLAVALGKESTNLQLHAAQAKLSQHAQDLEKQVDDRTARLREIITELETFSHTVAHDLRAPIRALTGYCQVLLEDYAADLPAEPQEILDRLYRACQRLDGLTQDLLEFSKVSRQEITLAPVNLDTLVDEALFLSSAAPGAVDIRRPLRPVLAHRTLLQQCLSNLIDNALKFVPAGAAARITLWTELVSPETLSDVAHRQPPFSPARHIENKSSTRGGKGEEVGPVSRVRIIVEDKGIGIAPEAHGKIFGIFERGTSSTSYPGSGIGLAIVARAMQRMGGACGVESELGVGSRFWLELPAA